MTERFEIEDTPIAGVKRVTRLPHRDERGFFERMFCSREMSAAGIDKPVVQVNRSSTRKKGVVRGLHFQYPPHAEIKFVSCIKGVLLDVALDLRADSATYLQWTSAVLSNENFTSFIIPEGCAHGFQTLTEDCEILYFSTAFYAPEHEDGVDARDPDAAIAWPVPITELSARDAKLPSASSIIWRAR